MNLNFERALTYISKDTNWIDKLLAGAGIILATFSVFLIPLFMVVTGSLKSVIFSFVAACIVSSLLWIIISGYVCETAHKRIQNQEDNTLPDWKNFTNLICTGFKYFVGYFLYFLPFILVSLIFLFITVATFGHSSFSFSAGGSMKFLSVVFCGACVLFLYLLTIVFLPLMMSNFFKEPKICSFVNFKQAYLLLKNNGVNYFVLILLFVALTLLFEVLFSVIVATVVGVVILPLVYMYFYYVIADLCAQFVLLSQSNEERKQDDTSSETVNDSPSC